MYLKVTALVYTLKALNCRLFLLHVLQEFVVHISVTKEKYASLCTIVIHTNVVCWALL